MGVSATAGSYPSTDEIRELGDIACSARLFNRERVVAEAPHAALRDMRVRDALRVLWLDGPDGDIPRLADAGHKAPVEVPLALVLGDDRVRLELEALVDEEESLEERFLHQLLPLFLPLRATRLSAPDSLSHTAQVRHDRSLVTQQLAQALASIFDALFVQSDNHFPSTEPVELPGVHLVIKRGQFVLDDRRDRFGIAAAVRVPGELDGPAEEIASALVEGELPPER